jgi:hypothetical protein
MCQRAEHVEAVLVQFGAVPNIMQRFGGGRPPAMAYAGMPGLTQAELPPLQGGAAVESMTSGWAYPPLPPEFAAREWCTKL